MPNPIRGVNSATITCQFRRVENEKNPVDRIRPFLSYPKPFFFGGVGEDFILLPRRDCRK